MEPLKDQIEIAKFDYVNSLINERNFPVPAEIKTTGWKLVDTKNRINSKDAERLAEKENYRAANLYELIEWKRQNGDDLTKACWVIALGQTFQSSAKGKRRFPFISFEENGIFTLSMGFYDEKTRGEHEYLLCVAK